MAHRILKAVVAIGVLAAVLAVEPAIGSINPSPQDYVPITPCNVADTRFSTVPSPIGKLTAGGSPYTFQVTGVIPSTQRDPGETCTSAPGSALGVMINVIAIQPDGIGNLRISPAGVVSSGGVVNYQSLAPPLNNSNAVPVEVTIVGAETSVGNIDIVANGADVHVRLVVLGYFVQSPTATNSTGVPEVNNIHPVLAINCIISTSGTYPSQNSEAALGTDPFFGEISWFAGHFAPAGWLFCDGQTLQIGSNSALFTLLGTTYGGDGIFNFNLPDMRGRSPMHEGSGPGLPPINLGQTTGSASNTQVPSHNHGIAVATP